MTNVPKTVDKNVQYIFTVILRMAIVQRFVIEMVGKQLTVQKFM